MATWTAIAAADFIAEGFNTDERTKLQSAAGGDDGLTEILASAIAEWRGVIEAAGTTLDPDTTKIPPSCRRHIIAQARWQVLIKFPSLKQLQTEERKLAAEKADEILEQIAKSEIPIEPGVEDDTVSQAGNWNANPKIAMRSDGSTRANE